MNYSEVTGKSAISFSGGREVFVDDSFSKPLLWKPEKQDFREDLEAEQKKVIRGAQDFVEAADEENAWQNIRDPVERERARAKEWAKSFLPTGLDENDVEFFDAQAQQRRFAEEQAREEEKVAMKAFQEQLYSAPKAKEQPVQLRISDKEAPKPQFNQLALLAQSIVVVKHDSSDSDDSNDSEAEEKKRKRREKKKSKKSKKSKSEAKPVAATASADSTPKPTAKPAASVSSLLGCDYGSSSD